MAKKEIELRKGCGCKLCNEPFVLPTVSKETKRLRKLAHDDYRKQVYALEAEILKRNESRSTIRPESFPRRDL